MKHQVILKSHSQGINLILDREAEFEALLGEVADKFRQSAGFFKEAHLALSFEGRKLSLEEEEQMIQAIEENSDVRVLCIVEKDDADDQIYIKAVEKAQRRDAEPEEREGAESENTETESASLRMYRGNVPSGATLEFHEDVLILGDVEEGALVASDGNILVMGTLRGEAFAAAKPEQEKRSFILALDFNPVRVRIGPYRINDKEMKGKGLFGRKGGPRIAHLNQEEEKILVEPVDGQTLALFQPQSSR